METRIVKVGAGAPDEAVRRAVRTLRKGGLVAFPTETVYGVAAVATNASAMERLRELKSRPARPFSVHLGRSEDVRRYVRSVPADAQRLIEKAWPGPVTLLLPTGGRLADGRLNRRRGLYDALCREGLIGLRCPDVPVARAMLGELDEPVVAPSANLAGQPSPRTARQVIDALDGRIEMLIDAGPTRHGTDSTIVRFDADGWHVVRKGVYDARMIRGLLRRLVVFVCTGNTCRSPMAAGLARKALADRLGCRPGELEARGHEVLSAGLFAGEGQRASPEAVRGLGADISRHRSRRLTAELIRRADMVLCMTDQHVADARRMVPDAGEKIRRLDPADDVPDPVGLAGDGYVKAARRIAKAVADALDLDKGLK